MQCSFPHLPLLSYPSLLLSHPPFLLFRYLALSSLVLPFLFIPQVLAPPLNPAKGPLEHCKLLSPPPFLLFPYLALSSLVLPSPFIPQVLAPPLNPAKGPLEHCKLPQWVRAEPGRQTGFGAF